MIRVRNHDEGRIWLETQPHEVSLAIAARAALRVLPLVEYALLRRAERFRSNVVLPCFRATVIPWVGAKYPTRDAQLHAGNPADGARAARTTLLGTAAGNTVVNAASSAAAAYSTSTRNAALEAISAITHSASASSGYFTHIINAANFDAAAIDNGKTDEQRRQLAARISDRPLWPDRVPTTIASAWNLLKKQLLAANEDWEVWIEWYEDRLRGRASIDSDIDLAYIAPRNQQWKDGPKVVNAEVRRMIDVAHKKHPLPDENILPTQTPEAVTFELHENGAIGLATPQAKDRLADTPEVHDFYMDVRAKSTALAALGSNMLGTPLYDSLELFRARIPENPADAIERLVWSSGNTLRSILAAHNYAEGDPDFRSDKLDGAAAASLRDLVETFNQLALADPNLRRRDASRPGPREHNQAITEINIVSDRLDCGVGRYPINPPERRS
jgi:hypothetical protein